MKWISLFFILVTFATTAQAEGWEFTYLPSPTPLKRAAPGDAADDIFSKQVVDEATKEGSFNWSSILDAILGSEYSAPTGAQADPVVDECQGRYIERQILAAGGDIKKIGARLQAYQQKCDAVLSRNRRRGMIALLDIGNIKYSIFSTPGVSPFSLKTPGREEIYGIIAQKPGPRPWIILKCGIFCESQTSSSIKDMLVHLYEDSPFNLVILNNHTATSNIVANQRVSFGGFYEGQEMMMMAYWLKYESPFTRDVAAIHGMGISLGGNAALYASYYNDHNTYHDERLFNSMVAYCPAANLEPTVYEVFRDTPKGVLFAIRTWNNLSKLFSIVSDIRDLFPHSKPRIKRYPEIIAQLSARFLSRLDPSSFLSPFYFQKPLDANDIPQYWRLNNFVNYSAGLQTPTLVWASENDWIVSNGINAGTLQERHNADPNTKMHVVNMKYGNHCAKSISYGWQAISSVLRGFYMSFTDPARFAVPEETVPFQINIPRLYSDEIVVGYEWQARAGDDNLHLDVKTWSPVVDDYNGCGAGYGRVPEHNYHPFTSDSECYEHRDVRVPIRNLASALGDDSLARPSTTREAESLTRTLNSRIEVWSSSGSPIGKRISPNQLRVLRTSDAFLNSKK